MSDTDVMVGDFMLARPYTADDGEVAWKVHNEYGRVLGDIRWHSGWRSYTWNPLSTAILTCWRLEDVAKHLCRLTLERRDKGTS